MSLINNPDEIFNKPLSVYPMTNPTPQTQPEPPAGLFSEQELREEWNAQADEFNQWDSLDLAERLAWAQARAIAADRAQRNRQEEQKWEANRRLWQCLINRDSIHSQVVKDISNWIDSGMTGPLPPLPDHFTRSEEQP